MEEGTRLTKILLVEDNQDDIMITQRALKDAKVVNKLWIVRDGQEALDFLQHKGPYSDPESAPIPGLILLDINLPKVNGMDVLREIKGAPELKLIPVIMLTMSKRDEDIVKSYKCGCNSFIQKPVEFEKFVEVIKHLSLYWGFMNVNLPEGALHA